VRKGDRGLERRGWIILKSFLNIGEGNKRVACIKKADET
jgi:hypothetical protein